MRLVGTTGRAALAALDKGNLDGTSSLGVEGSEEGGVEGAELCRKKPGRDAEDKERGQKAAAIRGASQGKLTWLCRLS